MIDAQIVERPMKRKRKTRTARYQRRRQVKRLRPILRFNPYAWAKLLFLRNCGECEVGGFGISGEDGLLLIEDVRLVRQYCTPVSVRFDDVAVADFFDEQVDLGRRPDQFARVWLHSHPGNSCEPSITDEQTFARVFGTCDWATMCIVAQDGTTYARLRFSVGPGGEVKIPVCVDYGYEFDAADFEIWQQQYKANVTEDNTFKLTGKSKQTSDETQQEVGIFGSEDFGGVSQYSNQDLLSEIDAMEPMEREIFMEELSVRSDFWDEESEVFYE